MEQYKGWVVRSIEPKTASDPPQDMPNIEWYRASDVAELARRVIDYIEHDADCNVGMPTLEPNGAVGEMGCDCGADHLIAELEQIAGK